VDEQDPNYPALEDSVPPTLREVHTRPLFVMRLSVRPYQLIGSTPGVNRRVGVVPGGVFAGERLSGEVLEGGNDWQSLRNDAATTLDVRLVLKTRDSALIGISYRGIRHGAADVMSRVDKGEPVDPSQYYFRTQAQFETSAPTYDWLNRILAIGIGYRTNQEVVYSLFEVL